MTYVDSFPSSTVTFDFSETAAWADNDISYSGLPTALVAPVVYESVCSSSATVATWDAILNSYMSSDASTFGETEGGAPPIVSVTGSATVRGGGNYTVKFPAENAVLAYVRDQTGTVLYLEDMTGEYATSVRGAFVGAQPFPAGTTALESCEATATTVSCSSTSIVPSYITSLENVDDMVNVRKTDIVDKDGTYVVEPDGSLTCGTYSIYVKANAGDSDAVAFAFSSVLVVTADLPFYTYLQCGSNSTVYWSEVTTSDVTAWVAPSGYSQEVTIDHPACEGDYADGTNITVDGRDCRCDKGTLFCHAEDVGDYFRLSDEEAVGIALSVSVIVILLLLALIFLCLKKTAQNQELKTVLAANTANSADDRL